MNDLICIVCGDIIIQPVSGKRRTIYCSNKCYRKHYHSTNKNYIEYKKNWKKKNKVLLMDYDNLFCKVCGCKIIQPKTGQRRTVFCSKKCYTFDKQSSLSYKEEKKLYDKEYRKKEEVVLKRKEYNESDRAKYVQKINRLSYSFNISEDMYRILLDDQNGCCDICGESMDPACVDHCHNTGAIRGLLCSHCNTAIGLLRDNVLILNNAIKYLEVYGT